MNSSKPAKTLSVRAVTKQADTYHQFKKMRYFGKNRSTICSQGVNADLRFFLARR